MQTRALDLVREAHDGGLADRRVLHECALDLSRAQTMTGHIDDVIDTPSDPQVSVLR